MRDSPNYRTMLLGMSMILFSIAVMITSYGYNLPRWLITAGHLLPFIGIIVCIIGFFVAKDS